MYYILELVWQQAYRSPFTSLGTTEPRILEANNDLSCLLPGDIVHAPRDASTYLHEAEVTRLTANDTVAIQYTTEKYAPPPPVVLHLVSRFVFQRHCQAYKSLAPYPA